MSKMGMRERSLRALVDKWLGVGAVRQTRVTRFGKSVHRPWRCVCVEAVRTSGSLSILSFRHDDGSWCVFPPQTMRPALRFA